MDLTKLIDKEALAKMFAEGTGAGVKVGILDTGVDSSHPSLDGCVSASYDVVTRGSKAVVNKREQGEDLVDHGTACAGIIHSIAPDAEICSIRVIGSSLGDTSKKLACGLEHAIAEGCDIINLSLGTARFFQDVYQLTEDAFYKGILLIASKDNRGDMVGYPAAFSSVLGVDMKHYTDPMMFRYVNNHKVEVNAKGIYVEAPAAGGGTQWYTGTSFACPHVSGMAARLRQTMPGLSMSQLRLALLCLSNDTAEDDAL